MADGLKNYQTFTGEGEEPSENVYEVQSRKTKGGKYETHLTTNKEQQAMFHYQSRNIGKGYTKRMLVNGKVFKRYIGY
jgi:hypothetical protein